MEQRSSVEFLFDKNLCKACGICVALCPKKVLEQAEGKKPVFANETNCIGCGICELHCPDYAIRVRRNA